MILISLLVNGEYSLGSSNPDNFHLYISPLMHMVKRLYYRELNMYGQFHVPSRLFMGVMWGRMVYLYQIDLVSISCYVLGGRVL